MLTPTFARIGVGLAAIGLLIAIGLPSLFQSASSPLLFDQAVRYYRTVTTGTLPVEYETADPQHLQATLNASGRLDYGTQVSDLRPVGYRLKGGRVTADGEQPLAVAVPLR